MHAGVARRTLLVVAVLTLVAGACSSGGGSSPPTTPSSATSTSSSTSTTSTTSLPASTTASRRTVLSPLGLNLRARPDTTAKVLGTAAEGVVLRVIGHVDANGGWFHVRGSTVTGWISSARDLSAPGEFRSYAAARFSVLYPATWHLTKSPPAAEFRPASGSGRVFITVAPKVSKLPAAGPGYGRRGSVRVLVCGVTTDLVTYQRSGSSAGTPYLAEIRFAEGPHNALGIYGHFANLGTQLQTYRAMVASVTFPTQQCKG